MTRSRKPRAAKLAERCQVQIAYAIGVAKRTSSMVDTMGTGKADDEKITAAASKVFGMRPGMMIRNLDLLRPTCCLQRLPIE